MGIRSFVLAAAQAHLPTKLTQTQHMPHDASSATLEGDPLGVF